MARKNKKKKAPVEKEVEQWKAEKDSLNSITIYDQHDNYRLEVVSEEDELTPEEINRADLICAAMNHHFRQERRLEGLRETR